jgi:recA bacterial DNA recombination protein
MDDVCNHPPVLSLWPSLPVQVVDTVLRSQGVDLVAVDSVAALLPRAEQEADICSAQVRHGWRWLWQAQKDSSHHRPPLPFCAVKVFLECVNGDSNDDCCCC